MGRKLLIIGAGNVGGYISYNIEEFGDYEVLGFLDDADDKQGKELYGRKVLGRVEDIDNFTGDESLNVVVGIANPIAKKTIVELLNSKNISFPNFIANNVWLSKKVKVGKGVIVYPGTSINYETNIEDFVIINMNGAIGHNCLLQQYVTLAPGVNLGGFTEIGEATDIGIGTSTRQGTKIGKGVVVGGQSMVVQNINDNIKVKGVPAKIF